MSKNYGIILISHGSSLPYGEVTFKEIKKNLLKKPDFQLKLVT